MIELDTLGWEGVGDLELKRLVSSRADERERVVDALLRHALQKLGANPQEHPLMLAEPAAASTSARWRMAEVMFEQFGVPALCISKTCELGAISMGRTTALVVDVGGFVTAVRFEPTAFRFAWNRTVEAPDAATEGT